MDVTRGVRTIAPYVAVAAAALMLTVLVVRVMSRSVRARLMTFSDHEESWDGASRAAFLLSFALVSLLGTMEVVASVGFAAGSRLGAWSILPAVVGTGMLLWFASKAVLTSSGARTVGTLAACAVGIVIACVVVSGLFFDVSWDGNTAHQVAVVQLAQGWNPLRELHVDRSRIAQWLAVENFPKGAWIRAAVIYRTTGALEQAKASGLILAIASWLAWVALLLAVVRDRTRTAMVLAGLVAVNPVVLAQAFTFMVDGQVASLFALSLAYCGLLYTRSARWPVAAVLAATLMMLATAKFTGLVYAVAIACALAVAVALVKPRVSRGTLAMWVCGGLIAALCLVGFNPYAENLLQNRSIFYPLVGANAVDIMSNNSPGDFVGTNRFQRLFRSLFSMADHQRGSSPEAVITRLKIPFSVHRSEIRPYLAPETRIAGLGPLFGGSLLLALIGVGMLLWSPRTRHDRFVQGLVFAQCVVVATVVINPEAWWARYAPQLWLLPVFAAIALVVRGPGRLARVLGWGLCALLIVNAAFVGAIGFANTVNARGEVTAALDQVAAAPGGVLLQQRQFETTWAKLDSRGIRYHIVSDETTLVGGAVIPYTTAVVLPVR